MTTPADPAQTAAPTAAEPRTRPVREMFELTVTRAEAITPGLVRVFFSGAPAAVYADRPSSDTYMKLYFATDGRPVPFPLDLDAVREERGAAAVPTQRTYSMRGYDRASGEMSIEFVVHGDAGVAGPWAARARAGDRIVATSPGGAYQPDPAADWHLLIGDESALPAIAASVERLPGDAVGAILVEVADAEHRVELGAPAGMSVRWLLRDGAPAGTTTLLADALAGLAWLPGTPHVFAHGEREAMKALRPIVREREIPRDRLSLSGYWAFGRSEDRFQAEKREPIGQIL